jgi:MoaA/NifB/PqqE/SkfB family radical SAM enzyme
MKIPHDKFCVLPWVSLEASPIGTVRPCCLADDELRDNTGKKFNLKSARFTDIQKSTDMQQLRSAFLSGQRPATCRKCWNEEDAGRTSKRMHTLDRLKHIVDDCEWTQDSKSLLFLDLKLGNICNLKCRICGSWSSSTFASEELNFVKDDKKSSFHYQMLRDGAWPRDNAVFWQEIDQIASQIRYLEFTGGEPFMIQEHFDMLQGLVDRGLAGNIEIHYNTNGTHYPEGASEIWRHFRLVEIAFSIDDVGARFEYQRTGARWNDVVANIRMFRYLRAVNPNIQLQVCSTVNVFNVLYLEQLANWIDRQRFDFVYWNIMHDAPHFSIRTLPENAKGSIAYHLNRAQVSEGHQDEFKKIIEFMNSAPGDWGYVLRDKIKELDDRRGESLSQVAPEFAELIQYDRFMA